MDFLSLVNKSQELQNEIIFQITEIVKNGTPISDELAFMLGDTTIKQVHLTGTPIIINEDDTPKYIQFSEKTKELSLFSYNFEIDLNNLTDFRLLLGILERLGNYKQQYSN